MASGSNGSGRKARLAAFRTKKTKAKGRKALQKEANKNKKEGKLPF